MSWPLLNPAGGILYHLRALIYKKNWIGFREKLSQALLSWEPPRKRLILLGPSGGYCLDLQWLCSFEHLVILEIDPLARWILKTRLLQKKPDLKLSFYKEDLIISSKGKALASFLELYPDCPVFFSNLLGQLQVLVSPHENIDLFLEEFNSNMAPTLLSRPWASFHDRLSGDLRASDMMVGPISQPMNDHNLAQIFFPNNSGEILSHQLPQFIFRDGQKYFYLSWKLTPRSNHVCELVYKSY